MQEPQSGNEAHHSGGLCIDFNHMGFSNMYLNLSTQAFLHFASTEIWPPQPGSNWRPRPQQQNIIATWLARRVIDSFTEIVHQKNKYGEANKANYTEHTMCDSIPYIYELKVNK